MKNTSMNLVVMMIAWWVICYGIASFGDGTLGDFIGTDGFFCHFDQDILGTAVTAEAAMMMLFGLAFCAVSLAVVWGIMLKRIKFGAYAVFALIFGTLIYPIMVYLVWGSGPVGRWWQAGDGLCQLVGRTPHWRFCCFEWTC